MSAAKKDRFGDPSRAVLRYQVASAETDEAGALQLRLSLYDMGERGETEEDGWSVDVACERPHEHDDACMDALTSKARADLLALRLADVARRPGRKVARRDMKDLARAALARAAGRSPSAT